MRALKISIALTMLTLFILMITGSANAGTPPILPTPAPGTQDAGNHTVAPTVRPTAPGTTIPPTVAPALVSTATPIPATPTPDAGGMDMRSLAIILIVIVVVMAAAGLYFYLRR